jgi:hypothetical protein
MLNVSIAGCPSGAAPHHARHHAQHHHKNKTLKQYAQYLLLLVWVSEGCICTWYGTTVPSPLIARLRLKTPYRTHCNDVQTKITRTSKCS